MDSGRVLRLWQFQPQTLTNFPSKINRECDFNAISLPAAAFFLLYFCGPEACSKVRSDTMTYMVVQLDLKPEIELARREVIELSD